MKHLLQLCLLMLLWMPAANAKSQRTYTNPILFADYSDPDVCRAGDDYYLTASSFNCMPGLPILHSKDLIHWNIIGHALPQQEPDEFFARPRHGLGVFAPSIRFHNNWFYIYWADPDRGIYMQRTQDPAGEWSVPVMVKEGRGYIDPCPLWDEDGSVYLGHALAGSRIRQSAMIVINKLSADGTHVTDYQGRVVYDGHGVNPTLEGTKLYKRDGWYWIFAPAGGVGGGWQVAMRARDIYGPYEARTVLARGTTNINGPHQGGWVTTPDGKEDWFLHFQHRKAYGRILHLQPMQWTADGWPVMGNDPDGDGCGEPVLTHAVPAISLSKEEQQYSYLDTETSDDFSSRTLGLQWQWQANPRAWWYYAASELGVLRLFATAQPTLEDGYGNLLDCPNLLLQKLPAEEFTVTMKATFHASKEKIGDRGGLIVMGYDYSTLVFDSRAEGLYLILTECINGSKKGKELTIAEVPLLSSTNTAWLRVEVTKGTRCAFSFSTDGKLFTPIGSHAFSAKNGGWIGAKVGMFCNRPWKNGSACWMDVDSFHFDFP